MRELEFLPGWYVRLRKRRRAVFLQLWMTFALAGGAGLWIGLVARNVREASAALTELKGRMKETDAQLEQMDRLENLRRQLRQQAEILASLGDHVDATRLMARLNDALPGNVSLLAIGLEVEERPIQVGGAVRLTGNGDPAKVAMERRLKVRVQGVAPTDLELSVFLTELNKTAFFEEVAPAYAKDRKESGHILREFEVNFFVDLTAPQTLAGTSAGH
jgi:Tfp pilus assembly protein PilN